MLAFGLFPSPVLPVPLLQPNMSLRLRQPWLKSPNASAPNWASISGGLSPCLALCLQQKLWPLAPRCLLEAWGRMCWGQAACAMEVAPDPRGRASVGREREAAPPAHLSALTALVWLVPFFHKSGLIESCNLQSEFPVQSSQLPPFIPRVLWVT